MFSSNTKILSIARDFRMNHMMRYSLFVPRLYNLCRSLGFEAGNIMPSRAFCSDETRDFRLSLLQNVSVPFRSIMVRWGVLLRLIDMGHMHIMARKW